MKNNTLMLSDFAVGYGDKTVCSGVSATLDPGTLTSLLGPNGSGKSTLLRTIAGLNNPLGGDMYLCGHNLRTMSRTRLANMVSVVLTHRIDAMHLTVAQLVALGRSPYTGFWGRLSEADRKKVRWAIEQTGMDYFADRRVSSLSDGELQKCMIAKALAQDTPVILLDEPTSFLDYPSKVSTFKLLRNLAAEQGRIVILSTHDVEMALRHTHQVWMMHGGAFTQCTPPQLYGNDTLCRALFGIEYRPDTNC